MWGPIISAIGNVAGGLIGSDSARSASNQAFDRQVMFAKKGIQWRVEDAKKAGVHPLFALGAQTHSYTPATVGDPLGQAVANMGQDIGRAVDANSTHAQRLAEATVKNMELRNNLIEGQIAEQARRITGPAVPTFDQRWLIPGQGEAPRGVISIRPGPTSSARGATVTDYPDTFREGQAIPDVSHSRTVSGGYSVIPSEAVKQRIEDQWLPELQWWLRNNLPSAASNIGSPPAGSLPRGWDFWDYNIVRGEWIPAYKDKQGRTVRMY